MDYEIVRLYDYPEMKLRAAQWFHEKWDVPIEAYLESIEQCIDENSSTTQWYIVLENSEIIAGIGVIENDFHDRKDLSPNVCAVYVEEEYRCKRIAGDMLEFVASDMKNRGVDVLYLLTEHTSFYERYGWEFLCMVQGDGEDHESRMYIHRS